MTKIKPLGKRVLVKRSEALATKGGILLPDSAQEKPRQGKVVAVGGLETVKQGDHVLFSSYAGTEVKDQDEDYLILSEDDILGVLDNG